jgi:hypothetical protein
MGSRAEKGSHRVICPLCERAVPKFSDHHLVPKCRGGTEKLPICLDCHKAIHATFSNKELEREYFTVEALLSHEGFRKVVRFLSRQDPSRRFRTKLTRVRRRVGRRNG